MYLAGISLNQDYRALVISPSTPDLERLIPLVEACNFTAMGVTSSGEAWEILEKTLPQLLVISLDLPDRGSTLIRKIIPKKPDSLIVIGLFDPTTPPEVESTMAEGYDFLLETSFSPTALRAALHSLTKCQQTSTSKTICQSETIQHQQQEMEELQDQIEQAFAMSNQTAMEAEMAFIELNMIFKAVTGGIVLIGKNMNIIRFNDGFLQLAEIDRETARTFTCSDLFPNHHCGTDNCSILKVIKGEPHVEFETEKKRKDGSIRHYNITATPYKGPGGELIGAVVYILDITERVRIKRELEQSREKYRTMSLVDELTGLFNKRHFNNTLSIEIDRADRYGMNLSLIMMDIDNFKIHNDTYGHDQGDLVLSRLGEIVAGSIRSCDTPCRYGGEEFTIILPETPGQNAETVAERVRAAMAAEPFQPNPDETVYKTLSLGIAEFQKGEKLAELLRRADQNLYKAKKSGKNRYIYE
ncbi:MAG: GGDEF domain-containing protein [Proteobacteria bacterium]|nr:GGDEF domain-containing protein [Pseudomonadota bacterium]MBU1686966.1 GGDEF domain-containing protein [Pseudomonadota bacterium]